MKRLELSLTSNFASQLVKEHSGFREPLFTFVSSPKAGKIKMLLDPIYCRESLCEVVRQDLRDIACNNINMAKIHMVIYKIVSTTNTKERLKDFQNEVLAGQRIVNTLEKHYGWPLTKVYPVSVNIKSKAKNNGFYYITAGKRWLKAPAMLSLFTLLFRIAANESKVKFKHKIRSMKSLFSALDDVASKISYHETRYYKVHGEYWLLVLNNYKKLFGGRSMKSLYSPGKDNYYFEEGINSLCDEDSEDRRLNVAFKRILKKYRGE